MPNPSKILDFAASLASKKLSTAPAKRAIDFANKAKEEALLKALKPGDKVMMKPVYTLGEELIPGGVSSTNMDRLMTQELFPAHVQPPNPNNSLLEVRRRVEGLYGREGLQHFNKAYESTKSSGEDFTMSVFRGLEYMEHKLGIKEYDPSWTGPRLGREP